MTTCTLFRKPNLPSRPEVGRTSPRPEYPLPPGSILVIDRSTARLGRGADASPWSPNTSALRILIVDDDRDTADTLTLLLRQFGHDTLTVFQGRDARDSVSGYAPDVILLDLSMPGVDGFELAEHARRVTAGNTVLVAHTGHNEEEYRSRARTAGIEHYLVKPADPDYLQALLEAIATSRSRRIL